MAILAALLLGGIGLQIIGPLVLRRFINSVAGGAETPLRQLFALAAVFLIAAAITQASDRLHLAGRAGGVAPNALRRDLAEHVLALDMAFHTARTPGELIERVDGGITALASFFSQFVIQILGGLLLMIEILAVLFHENPLVGGAMTIFATPALVILQATRNLAVEHYGAEHQPGARWPGFWKSASAASTTSAPMAAAHIRHAAHGRPGRDPGRQGRAGPEARHPDLHFHQPHLHARLRARPLPPRLALSAR